MTVCLQCSPALSFDLPASLAAAMPPEQRGVPRDGVRMLVASARHGIRHRHAYDLPGILRRGDLVVLNASATLPAALGGRIAGGDEVVVHLSTVLPASGRTPAEALGSTNSRWVVELRRPLLAGSAASYSDRTGVLVGLTGGAALRVIGSHPAGAVRSRLWVGELRTPQPLGPWLREHGAPIRYSHVDSHWPLSAYLTGYADAPGSAEMPSAGRPLTAGLLDRLRARGIAVARLLLHCGVSSLESEDPPYAEWFSVPAETATAVNMARAEGRRVIAVGTTVVRGLESAVDAAGRVQPAAGWTELVITPERALSTVDGLLTGWHEPHASHLWMLEALAGRELLCASYRSALEQGYLWHEFGDVHLLLP
ncbi:MAG: S-adenosylmethionine:tRNA ribosyltransferase-isomerase [Actinomycetota bacterium]|nr:S-adenosylmethionine:tRNA ribosyltransferase-isomerase [Actinomycetota bacterium]